MKIVRIRSRTFTNGGANFQSRAHPAAQKNHDTTTIVVLLFQRSALHCTALHYSTAQYMARKKWKLRRSSVEFKQRIIYCISRLHPILRIAYRDILPDVVRWDLGTIGNDKRKRQRRSKNVLSKSDNAYSGVPSRGSFRYYLNILIGLLGNFLHRGNILNFQYENERIFSPR